MLGLLGRLAFIHRKAIVVLALLVLPVAAIWGGPVIKHLKVGGFEDPTAESWQVRDELIRELGVGSPDIIALYKNPSGTVDDIEMMNAVFGALAVVEREPLVVSALNYYTTGAERLVSKDRTSTFVIITMTGDDHGKQQVLDRLRPRLVLGAPFETHIAGFIPVNQVLQATIESDVQRAEILAFPLTALLLVFIFGSLASASLPLVIGGFSVLLAFLAMRVMVQFMDLSVFSANVVTVLGLGLSVDYSLFLINRFREELHHGDVEQAVVRTMATTGRAVAFSGVTVALSLMGLFAFPQNYLRSMAIGGIAVVVCALGLSFTLLPALLALLGRRVDAWRVPFALKNSGEASRFWYRVAYAVMKRPLLTTVLVVVPLLVLGRPFFRIDPSIPDHTLLPKGSEPRVTMELIDRDFLPHQAAPHEVLVMTTGTALSRDNIEALYQLHQTLKRMPGIKTVDSVFSPADTIGKARLFEVLLTPPEQQDENVKAAIAALTQGPRMRFALIGEESFWKKPSLAQIPLLRALPPPPGATIRVGGIGAILFDMKDGINERTPLMVGFVAITMFIVLFLVFGSLTLPIKAMLMNSLSLTASFGAIVWVFQDGRFATFLHYEPLGISDVTAPLLMFAVVFGLSMDYEVLLLSRVREEYLKTGDNTLAVATGLARTGRLITSAAALLIAVIGAFATSQILFMKALGVGMALAIFLDATVIRALLVPAAMRLMGEWNWWAPAPLKRLWERIGLGDH